MQHSMNLLLRAESPTLQLIRNTIPGKNSGKRLTLRNFRAYTIINGKI